MIKYKTIDNDKNIAYYFKYSSINIYNYLLYWKIVFKLDIVSRFKFDLIYTNLF